MLKSALTALMCIPHGVSLHPVTLELSHVCEEQHSAKARYIAVREGFFVRGSLPQKLHNPGALVYVGQAHSRPHKSGFALFDTDKWGWVALEKDLAYKLSHDIDLSVAWEYM